MADPSAGFILKCLRFSRADLSGFLLSKPPFNNLCHTITAKVSGDNVQAYRFESGDKILLIMSVYRTGDCGTQMGFTQGYFVHVTDGTVLRVISERELYAYMRKHPEGS